MKQINPTRISLIRPLAAAVIVPLIAVAAVFGQATSGNLDPTFGSGGIVRTDFSGNIDRANAVGIQADGKIVAAGSSFSSAKTVEDFIVARYNTNGSLDKRFGSNGKITTDFFRNVDTINALVIQPDGKIVVAGFAQLAGSGGTPRVFAVARYTSDGRPDTTFGNGGSITTSFGGTFAAASAIMLQPDGKIVVAGTADFNPRVPGSGLDFAVARYLPNGGLDASFGDAGQIVFDFFGSFDQANTAALQPDGKIIVAGSASYDSFNRDIGFALTRFNADGTTDFSFATGGKQITSFFDAGAKANGIVIQPDGRFVVAGTASDSATRPVATDFALARYNSDGSLDSSFGIGGETAIPFSDSASEQANALALMSDGKIIVAGSAFKTFATPPDFALRRYNSDGSIDKSFGTDGSVITDLAGGTDNAQAVAIQADGNAVVAGRAFRSNFDLSLARYLNDVVTVIDTTPPTAPTNLGATFNPSTSAIDLSWTASTDNLAITGYRIFRDGATVPIATVNGTAFSDRVQTGTHTYTVAAIDAAGNQSDLSNTATATGPLPDTTPPSVPEGLTATVTANVINLSWSASTDDLGVTGYRVFRDGGVTPISTVNGTSFSDSGQLGSHQYAVAAIDAAGNQSGLSNFVIATVTVPEQVELGSLTLNPTRVTAPASSTGTITLSGAAPAGGVTVTLHSSDTKKATVPASVTVPEGATSATFAIKTLTGSLGGGENRVTISATLGSVTRSATLTIIRP
ncbi:MAG TPA: hypothetical protein VFI24_20870 [Pyrinomonadaceae bacterium]|nr:hypothetical protein [Pyrinomonadaceae bacterium]